MKHGKSCLTREKGSYYLGVAVGTKGSESSFVFEAVKKKNKDLFFFAATVTSISAARIIVKGTNGIPDD